MRILLVAAVGFGLLATVASASAGMFLFRPWADQAPGQWLRIAIPGQRTDVFTHWDRIWPVDRIEASVTPRAYARATRPIETVEYSYDGETRTVGEYLERANVNGILALSGGQVVFETYRNGIGPETLHTLWSASKSYTVTVLGIALKEGVIRSLDDSVETYAPQFAGTAYGPVSIRHVAMMSSGVQFFHDKGKPDRNDMYRRLVFQGENLDTFSAELGRRVEPGTDFNYLATDTHVLSAVLRGAYGRRFSDIVQDKLWTPGGFTGPATWSKHAEGADGVNFGHCCLQTRLLDFAHLGQLYLDDITVAGQSLTPDGWADLVTHPSAPFQEPGEGPLGYAMQFWVPNDYQDESMALGAFGQILWVDRGRGVVVAQVAAHGGSPPSPSEEAAVFRAIVTAALTSAATPQPAGQASAPP
ncbi:MAG: serine hydrolase [Pseudomonadota bacterium]